jgi:hypothetical protein
MKIIDLTDLFAPVAATLEIAEFEELTKNIKKVLTENDMDSKDISGLLDLMEGATELEEFIPAYDELKFLIKKEGSEVIDMIHKYRGGDYVDL